MNQTDWVLKVTLHMKSGPEIGNLYFKLYILLRNSHMIGKKIRVKR